MKYNQPYGAVADASYINGDPSVGRAGSIPPAASIENPQREIVNLINDAALAAATDSDLHQLAKAIQSQKLISKDDTGTANAYAVTLAPAPIAYFKYMTVVMLVLNSNTGASVINVNALGSKAIVRKGGSALLANDLIAGTVSIVIYNGTAFELLGANAYGRLTANYTIFVNSSIGNDANDGVSNTSGHALATLQKAVDLAFSYAPSQYAITIDIAVGTTYSAGCITPLYPGPNIVVEGHNSSTTVITAAGGGFGFAVQGPNTMTVQNVYVVGDAAVAGRSAFFAGNGGTMTTANTRSGNCGGAVFQASGAATILPGTHVFQGNAYAGFWANFGGNVRFGQSTTFTFQIPLAFTIATCLAGAGGSMAVPGSSAPSFVNVLDLTSGEKYLCSTAGGIDSSGAGTSYFPGPSPGTVISPGYYI